MSLWNSPSPGSLAFFSCASTLLCTSCVHKAFELAILSPVDLYVSAISSISFSSLSDEAHAYVAAAAARPLTVCDPDNVDCCKGLASSCTCDVC